MGFVQSEADHPSAIFSNCTEFDRYLKPTETPIFCPQHVGEKYFQICAI